MSLKESIRTELGAHCVGDDESINRSAIAEIIFSDREKREWLNSIVHKLVADDLMKFYEHRQGQTVFVESAILNTSGLSQICSRIWLVTAPEQLRYERTVLRDDVDLGKIRVRMKAQEMEFEEFPEGVRVEEIENDGSQSIVDQIDKLLNNLKSHA